MKQHERGFQIVVAVALNLFWGAEGRVEDWPTFQHDNRRSGYTAEKLDPTRFELKWSWRSPSPPQPAWAGPAKWDAYAQKRNLPSMRNYDFASHPIAVGEYVYFGSSADHSIHCLAAVDGREKWTFTTDAPIRNAPSYSSGKLYFGSDDGIAYCIDAVSGSLVWKFTPRPSQRRILNNSQFISPYPCRTGVLVESGIAYFGNALLPWNDAYLCAVDARTGKPTATGCYVRKYAGLTLEGAPAQSSQLLIYPQGRVSPRVFRRSDGELLGEITAKGKSSGGGSVVVVTLDARLFHGPAADTRRGGFQSSNPQTREMVAQHGDGNALVVSEELSYLLTDSALIASNLATRKRLWKVECSFSNALIGAGDVLIAGGDDGLAAYHLKDGRMLWRYSADGKVFGLAAANGRLLASTDTGVIHAFGLRASPTSPLTPTRLQQSKQVADGKERSRPKHPPNVIPLGPLQDENLVGHWAFQSAFVSNGTVKDLAGKLPATIRGNARLERVDDYQSLVLNGLDQSVLITTQIQRADLPKKQLTAEAWVRVDKPSNLAGIVGAVVDNSKSKRGWILGVRNSRFMFALAGVSGGEGLTYLTSNEEVSHKRWYHVAGSYDGRTMRLYVNGRLSNVSTTQRGEIHYPAQAFYEIGAFHDSNDYLRMTGRILEVRVYKHVLNDGEVALHFKERALQFSDSVEPARTDLLAMGPWLQFAQPGQATIRWRTKQPSPTRLLYRLDGPTHTIEDPEPKTEHTVRLVDLKRNRTYSYAIQTVANGQSHVTGQYDCDTFFDYSRPPVSPSTHHLFGGDTIPAARRAKQILKRSDISAGIALLFGVGDGRLAYHLARHSRLQVIAFETDVKKAASARTALLAAGVYGRRVAVHDVEMLSALPVIGRFANLAVIEDVRRQTLTDTLAAEVLRILRPDGGIVQLGPLTGDRNNGSIHKRLHTWFPHRVADVRTIYDGNAGWVSIQRHPLQGAGEWSHLYGRTDNSAFGGEQLGGAKTVGDLEVQWLGRPGPRFQADRSGRKPSPLSTGGRLFLQGLDRIVTLDAYNGSVLWALELPGMKRFNMPRDCSNWCADRNHVFAAIRNQCWQIDARHGTVERVLETVIPKGVQGEFDWGFVARAGDHIVGSAVRRHSSWTDFWGGRGWYDARSGEVTNKIGSDNLFSIDKRTGKLLWEYSKGVILNATITIAGGRVFFIECRHPQIKASPSRRLGGQELWNNRHLVALDTKSGTVTWQRPIDTHSGDIVLYLAHSGNRLVSVASSNKILYVDVSSDRDGTPLWNREIRWMDDKGDHGKAISRPAIVGDTLYVKPRVMSLVDGKLRDIQLPQGKCGTYACTTNSLFFRTRTVTMWDRRNATSSTWNRLRPDCWLSTIPAAGMLLSPEGGGGCSCGGWMETSIAFMPIASK